MEFPKEDNSTILVSTLQAQFPSAIGLKYRGSSGAWRALRAVDGVLEAPKDGWANRIYCLTIDESSKRKSSNYEGQPIPKRTRSSNYLQDIAVMNLPFQLTQAELSEYFAQHYGEL